MKRPLPVLACGKCGGAMKIIRAETGEGDLAELTYQCVVCKHVLTIEGKEPSQQQKT
jgi:hypothetical protein